MKGVLLTLVCRARSVAAIIWMLSSLLVMAPLALVALPVDRGQRLHDLFAVIWARVALAVGGIRVDIRGSPTAPLTEPCLVVANHQCGVDPLFVVLALQRQARLRFVSKLANFRLPIVGQVMHLFGHVAVDARSARRSLAGLHRATAALQTRSIVFFPEGTRTRTGRMAAFKLAPFRVAQRAGVGIVPVTIHGASEAMPPGRTWASPGARVTVQVHPRIPPMEDVAGAAELCMVIIEGALPPGGRRPPPEAAEAALSTDRPPLSEGNGDGASA